MAYENFTIRQFLNQWFKQDGSIPDEDIFELVKTEYIDTAGLYDEEEFEKVAYIHFLNNRINIVSLSVELEKKFLLEFGVPYPEHFDLLRKFSYRLKWNNDKEDFLKQLDTILLKEKKFTSQLEGELISLKKIRDRKKLTETSEPIKKTRESFIRTVNSLGKIGYRIDYNSTTVEELALMIKQQKESVTT